jgi:hypothetical protein
MLVAVALVMFIMVILSQAFVAGLESFRKLKALGDMEERLRMALTILRRDMSNEHFESARRLSDPNFWIQGNPREGFFRIFQGAQSTSEGTDPDGNPSWSATNNVLHFSTKLRGNKPEAFFQAYIGDPNSPLLPGTANAVPTNFFNQSPDAVFEVAGSQVYSSPWAEIGYFLVKTGTTDSPNDPNGPGSTPLYALYRSQLAVVVNNQWNSLVGNYNNYLEMSCEQLSPTQIYFNGPSDLVFLNNPASQTAPALRRGLGQLSVTFDGTPITGGLRGTFNPATPQAWGASLLLTDVVSFNVQILVPGGTSGFIDIPLDSNGSRTFDTGASPAPNYPILAIQVTLRIWDTKTQQTRQVTMVQDM